MQLENRGNGTWRLTIQEGLNPDGSQVRFRKTIKVDPKKSLSVQRKEAEIQAADDAAACSWIPLRQVYVERFGLRSIREGVHRFLMLNR